MSYDHNDAESNPAKNVITLFPTARNTGIESDAGNQLTVLQKKLPECRSFEPEYGDHPSTFHERVTERWSALALPV